MKTLDRVQRGKDPLNLNSLRGVGSGVMEIKADHAGDTYRTVYVAKFEAAVSTSEARRSFSDLLGRARYVHERFHITRKGQPVAAIVPLDDLEAMQALEDAMDVKAARESLRDAEEHRGTTRGARRHYPPGSP